MSKDRYSVFEIAKAVGQSERWIEKRAIDEGWSVIDRKHSGRGRPGKLFSFRSLPSDIRLAFTEMEEREMENLPATLPSSKSPPADLKEGIDPAASVSTPYPLTLRQQDRINAKLALIERYRGALKGVGHGELGRAKDAFRDTYNSGLAYPWIFGVLGKLSDKDGWKKIERWENELKYHGNPELLADFRGAPLRGKTRLSKEQMEILVACAANPNKPLISEAIRRARAIMIARDMEPRCSDEALRNVLRGLRKYRYDLWIWYREGEAGLKEKCLPYLERDYDRIEVGDILVGDAHVFNIMILNPLTGKEKRMTLALFMDMKSNYPLGWEIGPSENTRIIHAALYRSILRLGKIPKVVVIDNSKPFHAKHFNGLPFNKEELCGVFGRLGIKAQFTKIYHGQSKPVQKFFGTFGEFERWMPTYIGNSIANKPPRLKRGERLHRKAWEKATGGQPPTVEQVYRGTATWLDDHVQRPQEGHLEGKTPLEVFEAGKGPGVDLEKIRFLMMSAEVRHIQRNGIRFLGLFYYDPALYGRKHPCIIRYDLQDPSAIYVYDEQGAFICEARPHQKVHPAAYRLGTEEDQAQLKRELSIQSGLRKKTVGPARKFIEEHIIPEHRRQLEQAGVLEIPAPDKLTEMPRSVEKAPRETMAKYLTGSRIEEPTWKTFERVNLSEGAEGTPEIWDRIRELPDVERFKKDLELELRGWAIPKVESHWMTYFELTDSYRFHRNYWEEYRYTMWSIVQQESQAKGPDADLQEPFSAG